MFITVFPDTRIITGTGTGGVKVKPDTGSKDFIESLNPNSLKIIQAIVKPSLASAKAGEQFQFERYGCFVADGVDHTTAKPVFSLAVGLKDSWGK